MKSKTTFYIVVCAIIFLSFQLNTNDNNNNWPNWRGPNADGVSLNGTPPTEWSETKNVKWKTPIPGKGIGTPVVWGDQIFITTVIELDQKASEEAIKKLKSTNPNFVKLLGWAGTTENFLQFAVYSVNRNNGEINWTKVVREQFPHEGIHSDGSWALASCVTDGEQMVANLGSYGIYGFDMSGNLMWEKDFGDMQIESAFGEGTSAVISGENVIVVWDHEGQSKIHVLNKKTGKEIWQKDREIATTWSTPLVIEFGGKTQIIVAGEEKTISYDFENGNILWEQYGLGDGVIPCPVFDGERVYLMTGYGKSKIIQAIDLNLAMANKETSNAIVWTNDKNTSYVPSPLIKDGKIYFLKGNGSQITCVEAKTGKVFYEAQKLEGLKGVYASPVYANGNIYVLDRNGVCAVIKEGPELKVIYQNILDDNFDASPAIVGNEILLRGHKSLYCISE